MLNFLEKRVFQYEEKKKSSRKPISCAFDFQGTQPESESERNEIEKTGHDKRQNWKWQTFSLKII